MKQDKKVKVELGDIILISNKNGSKDCALVLEIDSYGIKMLTRFGVSTFKTDDLMFEKESVFSLS